jgi:hypothetical protein
MAAPAVADQLTVRFRDSKGKTSRLKVIIGGADHAATVTNLNTLVTDLAAVTNCALRSGLDPRPLVAYGSTAEFASVEDGALLTFADVVGRLHRFKIPAPKVADFATDQETVVNTGAMATVITDFTTFVYGSNVDTAPLTYIGGVRLRKKLHRKFTIFTKDPTLSGEGE